MGLATSTPTRLGLPLEVNFFSTRSWNSPAGRARGRRPAAGYYSWGNGKYDAAAFVRNITNQDPRRPGRHRLQQPDRLHQRAAQLRRVVQSSLLMMKRSALRSLRRHAGVAAEPARSSSSSAANDKRFGQAAYERRRWKKETGKPYLEFEIANAAQREQYMARRLPSAAPARIVGVGFPQARASRRWRQEFPKLQFAIVDSVGGPANVQSFVLPRT